jgi:hypothetical protein
MCKFQPTRSYLVTYTPVARSTLIAGAHEATPNQPELTMPPPNTQQPAYEPRSAQASPTGYSSVTPLPERASSRLRCHDVVCIWLLGLELPEPRAHRWRDRRAAGRLADRSPDGSPMHGLLAEEGAEILALFPRVG